MMPPGSGPGAGLIPCPACGNGVSSAAQACPRCGHPLQVAPAVQPSAYGPPGGYQVPQRAYAPPSAAGGNWLLANAGLLMMLVGGAGMFGGCVAGVNAGFVVGVGVWGVSFVLAVVGRVLQSSK